MPRVDRRSYLVKPSATRWKNIDEVDDNDNYDNDVDVHDDVVADDDDDADDGVDYDVDDVSSAVDMHKLM